MMTLRWAVALIFLLCIGLTLARMRVDGITVLGLVAAVVLAWALGAFTRSFWAR